MKTKQILTIMVLLAAFAFDACKTSKKTVNADKEKITNNEISKKDTIPYSYIVWDTVIGKTKESLVKKIKSIEGSDTVFEFIHYIDDPSIDTRPPKGKPITEPLPQIFTDLFPDVKWELVIDEEGFDRYYQTVNIEGRYAYDIVNDFVYSRYKPGEVTDKQLIDFFIFLFFHPFDSDMKIISTKYFENKVKEYYNYESIIVVNNEQIEFYTLIVNKRIYAFVTYKNGSPYKTRLISR
jgi:hypothetical protein